MTANRYRKVQLPKAVPGSRVTSVQHFSSLAGGSATTSLTHLDSVGRPAMVDVTEKRVTKRSATATGCIYVPPIAYRLATSFPDIPTGSDLGQPTHFQKSRKKGDALTVAQLAAIMACKKTSDLIPLCHPLPLSHISVTFTPKPPMTTHVGAGETICGDKLASSHRIVCRATVSCEGRTGVEMEALTAVSIGLLTLWDMLKAVAGKEMQIGQIMVTHKEGGKSGDFTREAVKSQ
jgi:molybdenum cofactor biosynthesis protein MoaC